MRCLEKPVLRARIGCEISALHGNWSAVQPGGFEGDVVLQLHRACKCVWMAKVKGAGWRFFLVRIRKAICLKDPPFQRFLWICVEHGCLSDKKINAVGQIRARYQM